MPATQLDRTTPDPAAAAASKAGTKIDAITRDFPKLLEALKLKRPGLNFYALRHTFQTIAGDARDEVAVKLVMEHDASMGAVYRERIDDKRLRNVVESLHAWVWPKPQQPEHRNQMAEEQTSVPRAN